MQHQKTLVSIIIPAYNASVFIEETIRSIQEQTYQSWEIVVINDGSTDNTIEVISLFNDSRINCITQQNAGVAAARNKGLLHAKGDFVVFFDADDIMTRDFLAERVIALEGDRSIGYIGGQVQFFPVHGEIKKAATDPVNEILFSKSSFATAPSNYMFRKRLLVDNNITFNEELNSSADRFFILEVAGFAKGRNLKGEKGRLLYRVTSQSMSNNISPKLIKDNEKFFYELKRKNLLPKGQENKFKSFYFLSLAIGFGMVRYWKKGLKYLAMSFVSDPVFFARNCGEKITSFRLFRFSRAMGH